MEHILHGNPAESSFPPNCSSRRSTESTLPEGNFDPPPRTGLLRSLAAGLGKGRLTKLRSHPLIGSQAGWTAFDFIAGVICVGLASTPLLNRTGSASPRNTFETAICGLMFGLCISLFTRRSFSSRSAAALHGAHEYRRLAKDVSLSALMVGGLLALTGLRQTNQVLMETEICLTVGVMAIGRAYWKHRRLSHRRRGDSIRNFAIAGRGAEARKVRDYLLSLTYAGYRFKGFVALEDDVPAETSPEDQLLGPLEGIVPVARAVFVDEIFFVRPTSPRTLKTVLKEASAADIDVRLVPGMTETLEVRNDLHYIGDLPTVVLLESDDREIAKLIKRVIDVVGATLALVLFSPLLLTLALWVRLDSSGPSFYSSERVGLKGRTFRCVKLRTMVRNAHALRDQLSHLNERDGILFKISKDPRVTRIGAILRKYSLDELPQFWNVLCGDMSLVGPRPPIRSEVEQYSIDQFCRLEVQPGITGLWQVEARADPSFASYIEFDRRYVNDWSIFLDLKILFRTLEVVVRGTGT